MAVSTKSVDTTDVSLSPVPGVSDLAMRQPDDLKPATDVAASGAMIEPTIVERVDFDHPAVDNNPRKGMPVASNQIDFNDPTVSQEKAVEESLEEAADKPKSKA